MSNQGREASDKFISGLSHMLNFMLRNLVVSVPEMIQLKVTYSSQQSSQETIVHNQNGNL